MSNKKVTFNDNLNIFNYISKNINKCKKITKKKINYKCPANIKLIENNILIASPKFPYIYNTITKEKIYITENLKYKSIKNMKKDIEKLNPHINISKLNIYKLFNIYLNDINKFNRIIIKRHKYTTRALKYFDNIKTSKIKLTQSEFCNYFRTITNKDIDIKDIPIDTDLEESDIDLIYLYSKDKLKLLSQIINKLY
jgi:hypothetical protein